MTDPDTLAAFRTRRPSAADAVPRHIDDIVRHVGDEELVIPPFDDVFDGVPKALPDDITERVIAPQNVNDDDWDEDGDEDCDEDAVTVVRRIPVLRPPVDPTGCMM